MFSILSKYSDVKNFILYFFPVIFSLIAGIFTFSVYSKSISAENYGIISNLIIYFSILYVIFSYGLSISGQKIIYVDNQTYEERLGNLVIFFILNFIFVLILVFLFRNLINKVFFDNKATLFIIFLGPIQVFLLSIKNIPLEIYRSKKKAGLYASLTISFTVIEPIILIFFLLFSNITLSSIINIKYIAFISSCILFFIFSIKNVSLTLNIPDIIRNLKVGLPNVPSLLSNWLVKGSNRIFLTHFYSLSTVGIYSANIKIERLITSVIVALNNTIFPNLVKNAKDKNSDYFVLKISMAIFTTIPLLVIFFGKEFILFFSKKEYFQSNLLFILVAIYSYLFFIQHIFWPYLIVNNKINYTALVKFFGAIVNIISNFFLIKYFSFIGAAWATLITYLFITMFLYKPIRDRISLSSIVLNIMILLLSSIFILLFQSSNQNISVSEVILKLIGYIFAVCLIFISNRINPKKYLTPA